MDFKNKKYNLDSASTVFALGRKEGRNYNVRLSISLNEAIDKFILEKALKETVKKYPYFFVKFVKDKNSLVAEVLDELPEIIENKDLKSLNFQDNCKDCEVELSIHDKTMVLEYSHAISDGKGGIQFLLSLTIDYLSIKYNDKEILNAIEHIPIEKQLEDGYKVHAKGFNTIKRDGYGYRIKGELEEGSDTNVKAYYLQTNEIIKLAKENEVSLNALLTSLMFMALMNVQKEGKHSKKQRIRLNVPVNLRTRFESNTMRNFILNVYPEIKPQKEDMELSDICKIVHKYIKEKTDVDVLAGRCASANKIFETGILDFIPLSIKKSFILFGFNIHSRSTMTFSNLGILPLEKGLDKYVSDFEIVFSTKPRSPYSATIMSIKDKTKITFLRSLKEPILEKQFEEVLKKTGIIYTENIE